MPARRIFFHVNADKPGALAARRPLSAAAAAVGLEVVESSRAEFVVVVGGDGTMLSAAHAFPGVPLLGLNFGGLGYLSAVESSRFAEALGALAAGRFVISRRTALDVRVGSRSARALNDVVVSRGVSGHSADISLSVDGHRATRFSADGLVVATPTGSTAYSLSAGGPVLLPDSRAFVVSPVCPHALASRPVVVPDAATLVLSAVSRDGLPLSVHADGEDVGPLSPGEEAVVAKSAQGVPLVQLEGYDPYEVLSRKLGWSGSSLAS